MITPSPLASLSRTLACPNEELGPVSLSVSVRDERTVSPIYMCLSFVAHVWSPSLYLYPANEDHGFVMVYNQIAFECLITDVSNDPFFIPPLSYTL